MEWNEVYTSSQKSRLINDVIAKIIDLFKLCHELGIRNHPIVAGFYGDGDMRDEFEVVGIYGDGDKLVLLGDALYQKMFYCCVPKISNKPYKPYEYSLVSEPNPLSLGAVDELIRVVEKYQLTPKLTTEAIARLKKRHKHKVATNTAPRDLEVLISSPRVPELIFEITLGCTSMAGFGDRLVLRSDGLHEVVMNFVKSTGRYAETDRKVNASEIAVMCAKYDLQSSALTNWKTRIERM